MKTMNTISKNNNHSRMRLFSLLLMAVFAVSFSSCSDDDNTPAPTPAPTVKEYLTSEKWYIQSATYYAFDECERQQYFLFNADNTIAVKRVGTEDGVCVAAPLLSGTYELSASNVITISVGTDISVFKIISITQNIMVVEVMISGNPENVIFDKTEG